MIAKRTLAVTFALAAAAAASAHADAGPPHVQLTDQNPNPMVIGRITAGESFMDVEKLGLRGCDGSIVKGPVAVLELPRAMKNLVLRAPGANVLVVRLGKDGAACHSIAYVGETPELRLDEWPAGNVEVYVGGLHKGDKVNAAVELEDENRAVILPWESAEGLDRRTLDALPPEAMVFGVDGKKGGPVVENKTFVGCRHAFFHAQPDLVLDVKRPLEGIQLDVKSREALYIQVVGPLTPNRRNLPTDCIDERERQTQSHGLKRLDEGTYAIFFGVEERRAPAPFDFVLYGPHSKRDPLTLAGVPDELALADRNVLMHFPFLVEEELLKSDALAADLWTKAPRALFVFARVDMDETLAKLIITTSDGNGDTWPSAKPPATEYPKKDEPMLLIGGSWVLTADGLIFQVNPKDLAEKPAGQLAFPAAARAPLGTFDHHLNVHGSDDEKTFAAWKKVADAYDKCSHDIAVAVVDRIAALQNVPTAENELQIRRIQEATSKKIERTCNASNWDKKKLATWQTLIQTRTARRTAQIGRAKERLAEMFK